jgi:hypothetical protein
VYIYIGYTPAPGIKFLLLGDPFRDPTLEQLNLLRIGAIVSEMNDARIPSSGGL